jgi:hypothetical protein
VLIVVDVLATPCLVARVDVPAALYTFTVYDDALATAAHDTSSDFAVEAVAVTATFVGVASVSGGAITETGVNESLVVP